MLKYLSLVALASLAAACATDTTSRCEQAAAAVADCTGAVPDGFVEACEANAEENGDAVVDSLLAATCDGSISAGGKADGLKEDAFVLACKAAMGAGYFTNWLRSPASEPLPKLLRDRLRPEYGALVDTVRVSWGAHLPDKWTIGPVHIVFGDLDVAAQTFGDEVFVAKPYTSSVGNLLDVAHELQHVRQSHQRGGLGGFERDYCRAFWDSNFDYHTNALEIEAYAFEDKLTACLRSGGTNCQAK